MAVVTSRQIKEYYEKFGNIDVTFTKQINDSLCLTPNQIFLKYKGGQSHCVIYSTSLTESKIVVALSERQIKTFQSDTLVSLRFCFFKEDRNNILSFFVQCRITGLNEYDREKGLHFVQLTFTQRPPDDLIEILGSLLEANINATRRREERIIINTESIRRMGITAKNTVIEIDGLPRNGLLRDLSFGGLKIIVMGNAKFLIDKPALVHLELNSGKMIPMSGKIVRFEPVEGRRDIAAIAVQYDQEKVTLEYKMIINAYLKHAGRITVNRK